MRLHFEKYHGCGNDFIILKKQDLDIPLTTDEIKWLCDRHTGIGADGLMIIEEEATTCFYMSYYNSDGRESTMCGNGGRCAVLAHLITGYQGEHIRFLAMDGIHEAIVLERDQDKALIKLKMKPVDSFQEHLDQIILDTGSPHAVVFTTSVQHLDVPGQGAAIRYGEPFRAEGINVDFAEQTTEGLFVRTYERGVEDETLSCGTGVTAAVLAASWKDPSLRSPVKVTTPGGPFKVFFERKGDVYDHIWLEGPAIRVFTGNIEF